VTLAFDQTPDLSGNRTSAFAQIHISGKALALIRYCVHLIGHRSRSRRIKPRILLKKTFGACRESPHPAFNFYFGITSRANLLDTTSRSSLRFFAASIIASREP
jgi:hypothetical protein